MVIPKFTRVLEVMGLNGGYAKAFIPPTPPDDPGSPPFAVLWVTAEDGSQGAVYLGTRSLDALGNWALDASRSLRDIPDTVGVQ
jgi:hypothetical protein